MADDFFLMVHDDLSGRPRLSDRILGLGLAGALLCELAILRAIDVEDGELTTSTDREDGNTTTAGADEPSSLTSELVREVRGEQRLPVRDWLNYLAADAAERVAGRMAAEALVYRKTSRLKLLGVSDRWMPMDTTTAEWPAIDVKLKVHNGNAYTHHLVLFGLTRATGLRHPSLFEVQGRLEDPAALEKTLEPLDGTLPLRQLLAHTEAAVGSAVTSQRIG
ncbi:GOLPH3/VPS74 family protein [Catenulispora yoronensis]|uniref:GOLPH3/VPS74 family protein n=1 Tax=Catenulispora yoronensis TaxID=450799 RepID=UPI0031DBFF57